MSFFIPIPLCCTPFPLRNPSSLSKYTQATPLFLSLPHIGTSLDYLQSVLAAEVCGYTRPTPCPDVPLACLSAFVLTSQLFSDLPPLCALGFLCLSNSALYPAASFWDNGHPCLLLLPQHSFHLWVLLLQPLSFLYFRKKERQVHSTPNLPCSTGGLWWFAF